MRGPDRVRRLGVLLGVIPALVIAGASPRAAGGTADPGKAIVIFVDFSSSVRGVGREAFREEIEGRILPSLRPGDRIVIAPIHDRTLTDFRPLAQGTLPATPVFNGWFDNVLKHNQQKKEIEAEITQLKATIKADVSEAFRRRTTSRYTDILSSLLVTEKLFSSEPRRKVLVLMSDMIEDSPLYNFDVIKWGPGTTEKLVSELQAKRMVPDLSGVCIYVSGVSARSAELAQHIGRFWETYFKQARADMDPSRYAHVLLHWPPSNACPAR